uniref:Putative secreted protein n=1 Tax=Panstrongylus lignarius TaxID=156445 RepID=A0A224XJY8_9HEMI
MGVWFLFLMDFALSGSTVGAGKAKVRLKIGDIEDDIEFYLVDISTFRYKILLGIDAIRKFRLIQDENLNIWQRRKEEKGLRKIEKENNDNISECAVNKATKENYELVKVEKNEFIKNFVNKDEDENYHLNREEKGEINKLVEDNIDCFAVNKYDVGCVDAGTARIKLLVVKYITQRPYRCSLPDRIEIEKYFFRTLERRLGIRVKFIFCSSCYTST